MKEAFLRLLIYFAIAISLDGASHTFPVSQSLPFIIGHYLGTMAPLAVIGETITIIRNIRHNRRVRIENLPTKQFDVPETNKLPKPL